MAYTKDGKYYNEETHYLGGLYECIIPKKRPKAKKEDFNLNFRINEEVLKKFSDYCKKHTLKKSKVIKKFVVEAVDNNLSLKKFEKYNNEFLSNNRNIAITINKELYDNFVKVCHEKGYKDVSKVLRSFIAYSYSEEVSEESEEVL